MSRVDLLTLILPRREDDSYTEFLQARGLGSIYAFPCRGTAGVGLLALLGLQDTEKILLMSALPSTRTVNVMDRCVSDMGLNMPGHGIAFTVPLDACGGKTALSLLLGAQELPEEAEVMAEKSPCVLLVAICESGHAETVMDAARPAGARGGTVVHAKGTAGELVKKFLGVSLATEKEMILILVSRRSRDDVMQAVMEKAGIHSPAHTVLFALPVEHVAGLRSVLGEEEEPNG